ncbi:protein of unknown function [Candidatus Nitrosacidococcus tergens]|uniref:Uncharacterized protein n=1 Tax=Candidatus Nitrosacidococcus tergens TaxID=553981 RepID=A0A7G1Q9Z5_9GAMM|nr:protein of unknown function [Candidatus Nitrosacidococcus tergens]
MPHLTSNLRFLQTLATSACCAKKRRYRLENAPIFKRFLIILFLKYKDIADGYEIAGNATLINFAQPIAYCTKNNH